MQGNRQGMVGHLGASRGGRGAITPPSLLGNRRGVISRTGRGWVYVSPRKSFLIRFLLIAVRYGFRCE